MIEDYHPRGLADPVQWSFGEKTLRPIGALSATSRIRALSKYGYLGSYRVTSRKHYVEQAELRLLITRTNVFVALLGKSPDS